MEKPFWDRYPSIEEAELAWEEGAEKKRREHPLKVLKTLPQMPGIAEESKKYLSWKSLKWMVQKDEGWHVLRHILKKPFTHLLRYCRSLLKKKSYVRDGDFFFYGLNSVEAMKKKIPMGRCVQIDDIASLVAWIVSPGCSFTTGFTFDVSGGRAVY